MPSGKDHIFIKEYYYLLNKYTHFGQVDIVFVRINKLVFIYYIFTGLYPLLFVRLSGYHNDDRKHVYQVVTYLCIMYEMHCKFDQGEMVVLKM